MELHIFDFDGTIFNSPAPRVEEVERAYGASISKRLSYPVDSGGLGWFQSLSSLTPPAVPMKPDVRTWYVLPVVEVIERLRPRNAKCMHMHSTSSKAGEVLCFVLTGRDEKYRERIESLLDNAGLLADMTKVFLKPYESSGTVKHKLNTIFQLIREHQPSQVCYYDDRPHQSGKLYEGIRLLQKAMYPTTAGRPATVSLSLLPTEPLVPEREGATGNHKVGGATILSFNDLYGNERGQRASAVRAAERWTADTVKRFHGWQRSSPTQPHGPSTTTHRAAGGDSAEAARFQPPPPFHFALFLMPPALAALSEQMLSSSQQSALIDTLLKEKADYDAGSDPFAQFRGSGPNTGDSGRGQGKGARGCRSSLHAAHPAAACTEVGSNNCPSMPTEKRP